MPLSHNTATFVLYLHSVTVIGGITPPTKESLYLRGVLPLPVLIKPYFCVNLSLYPNSQAELCLGIDGSKRRPTALFAECKHTGDSPFLSVFLYLYVWLEFLFG